MSEMRKQTKKAFSARDCIWIEYDEAHNGRLCFIHLIKNNATLIFSYDSQDQPTQKCGKTERAHSIVRIWLGQHLDRRETR